MDLNLSRRARTIRSGDESEAASHGTDVTQLILNDRKKNNMFTSSEENGHWLYFLKKAYFHYVMKLLLVALVTLQSKMHFFTLLCIFPVSSLGYFTQDHVCIQFLYLSNKAGKFLSAHLTLCNS